MPAYICVTCGVQYPPAEQPPARCPICEDERQYVGWGGQQWTALDALRQQGHRTAFHEEEPGITSLVTVPKLGIGQRALLVQTPAGNLLWDCLSYLDEATIAAVRGRGGLQAIAISHPHFYGSNVEWSEAFGGAPVYIHAADRGWVQRPSPQIVSWAGETTEPLPGLTLVHLGGHFAGAAVLHWPAGADGRGVLCSGDTITVVPDRRFVSVMYSYPNYIPVSAASVRRIAAILVRYRFERIYGAFSGLAVLQDGPQAIERSAARYVKHLQS